MSKALVAILSALAAGFVLMGAGGLVGYGALGARVENVEKQQEAKDATARRIEDKVDAMTAVLAGLVARLDERDRKGKE